MYIIISTPIGFYDDSNIIIHLKYKYFIVWQTFYFLWDEYFIIKYIIPFDSVTFMKWTIIHTKC